MPIWYESWQHTTTENMEWRDLIFAIALQSLSYLRTERACRPQRQKTLPLSRSLSTILSSCSTRPMFVWSSCPAQSVSTYTTFEFG